jgi:L-lactate dehydrogenase complex protein LldG
MSARENILGRLRAAPKMLSSAPKLDSGLQIEPEILLEQFLNNVKDVHAEVIDIRHNSLLEALAHICKSKNINTLMLPPNDFLDLKSWKEGPVISRFNQPIENIKRALFDHIDAGITIADGAIADTGTLFHTDSIRTPRTLSLVPPIHICVLDICHLYSNMQLALDAHNLNKSLPTNLIFITGPSKTSDIQQTVAYGAHGPRELILLLRDKR